MSGFHPAWEEGRQAYVDGDGESDCTYRPGTEDYLMWHKASNLQVTMISKV